MIRNDTAIRVSVIGRGLVLCSLMYTNKCAMISESHFQITESQFHIVMKSIGPSC